MALPDFAAGQILTAAGLDAAFAALFPHGVWTDYTPTLTQSATVTKTTTYGRYLKIGRLVVAQVNLSVTGAGTAANSVLLGLPVAAAAANVIAGSGIIFDTSASTVYPGIPEVASASTVLFWPAAVDGTATGLGARGFVAGLASGDIIRALLVYESAA